MAEISKRRPYIPANTDGVSLNYGGDPPGGGSLEARVGKLEALAEDTRGTLETIQRQLSRMDAKLDAKPDQGWIVNLICVIFGLVLAAIAATASIVALMN